MSLKTLLTVLALACTFASFANTEMTARQSYIEKYKHLAIEQMHLTDIPASIILAQAIIESGNGESELALSSNNHFGIKCKAYWEGKTFYFEDDDFDDNGDLLESCFRSYDSVEASFRNHSEFLTTTPWYAELFDYGINYEKWAYGLKRIGYASSPTYAEKLISVIEANELYKLDDEEVPDSIEAPAPIETLPHVIAVQNDEIGDPIKEPMKPIVNYHPKRKIENIETTVITQEKISSSSNPYLLIAPVTREQVLENNQNEPIECSASFNVLTQHPTFRRFEMR